MGRSRQSLAPKTLVNKKSYTPKILSVGSMDGKGNPKFAAIKPNRFPSLCGAMKNNLPCISIYGNKLWTMKLQRKRHLEYLESESCSGTIPHLQVMSEFASLHHWPSLADLYREPQASINLASSGGFQHREAAIYFHLFSYLASTKLGSQLTISGS